MNRLTKIFLISLLLCVSSIASALENEKSGAIKYSISPSTDQIKLARPFKLTFEINQNSYSKNLKIGTTNQNTEPFEIISIKEISPETPEGEPSASKKFEFTIIPFDIGIATFPALSWSLQNEEGKILKLESPAIAVNILPYVKKEDKDVRDIYPPFKFFSLLKAIMLFLIVAAVIAAIIFTVMKRRDPIIQKIKGQKNKTPYQKAMANIRILTASKLWTQGKQKKFYIRLSDILRIYIMDEFSITAPLMTTNTLLKKLKTENSDIELLIKVKELLQFSDLVKFAKLKPSDEERDRGLTASKEIIRRFHSYREEKENLKANG